MAARDMVLDALAWAGITEKARVAKIAAGLVRDTAPRNPTKSAIKEAVKATAPPYGRGKAITEAVTLEYQRQMPIHIKRRNAHNAWESYLETQAKRETRINNAYAYAFNRPAYEPAKSYPGPWDYSDEGRAARREWNEKEDARDKGDDCIAITHYDDHVVALVVSENGSNQAHVATVSKDGEITRTYLKIEDYDDPDNLVEAALLLGGPKVQTALSLGKKVVTDWPRRRTLIHHEGQDYHRHYVEELPWRSFELVEKDTRYGPRLKEAGVLILGNQVIREEDED